MSAGSGLLLIGVTLGCLASSVVAQISSGNSQAEDTRGAFTYIRDQEIVFVQINSSDPEDVLATADIEFFTGPNLKPNEFSVFCVAGAETCAGEPLGDVVVTGELPKTMSKLSMAVRLEDVPVSNTDGRISCWISVAHPKEDAASDGKKTCYRLRCTEEPFESLEEWRLVCPTFSAQDEEPEDILYPSWCQPPFDEGCDDFNCLKCGGSRDVCECCGNGLGVDEFGECVDNQSCSTEHCLVCPPNEPDVCSWCHPGFVHDPVTGECVCFNYETTGCRVCDHENPAVCLECLNDNILPDENGICGCTQDECVSCDSADYCRLCQNGWVAVNGECISIVPQCYPIENCDICTEVDGVPDECHHCKPGYTLLESSNECVCADPKCLECDGPTYCVVCRDGQQPNIDGTCPCADPGCTHCPEDSAVCTDACPPGEGLNPSAPPTCLPCAPPVCEECGQFDHCVKCGNNWVDVNLSCICESPLCQDCEIMDGRVCTSCVSGQAPNPDGTCPCQDSNCASCPDVWDQCVECSPGWSITEDGTCVESCPTACTVTIGGDVWTGVCTGQPGIGSPDYPGNPTDAIEVCANLTPPADPAFDLDGNQLCGGCGVCCIDASNLCQGTPTGSCTGGDCKCVIASQGGYQCGNTIHDFQPPPVQGRGCSEDRCNAYATKELPPGYTAACCAFC